MHSMQDAPTARCMPYCDLWDVLQVYQSQRAAAGDCDGESARRSPAAARGGTKAAVDPMDIAFCVNGDRLSGSCPPLALPPPLPPPAVAHRSRLCLPQTVARPVVAAAAPGLRQQLSVIVASQNAVKINAVAAALRQALPAVDHRVSGGPGSCGHVGRIACDAPGWEWVHQAWSVLLG